MPELLPSFQRPRDNRESPRNAFGYAETPLDSMSVSEFKTRLRHLYEGKIWKKGVGSVRFYGNFNQARHCIVHIKITHLDPEEMEPHAFLEQATQEAEMVQRSNIAQYTILNDLHRQFGKLPLYPEGIDAETFQNMHPARRTFASRVKQERENATFANTVTTSLYKLLPSVPERLHALRDRIDETVREGTAEYHRAASALQHAERNLNNARAELGPSGYAEEAGMADVRVSEDKDIHEQAMQCLKNIRELMRQNDALEQRTYELMQQHTAIPRAMLVQAEHIQAAAKAEVRKFRMLAFDQREDALLAKIAESKAAVGISPFGGQHDFERAVNEWNKKHPHEQFALVEITPRVYIQDSQNDSPEGNSSSSR